jgi:hypothetical protein
MPGAAKDEQARRLAALQAIPKADRLDFLAGLPEAEQAAFKRLMAPADIKKLNDHIDRGLRQRAKPSVENWLAEARAGRATSTDAMVDVLKEIETRLRPQDQLWLRRLTESSPGGLFSKRQANVIRSIYRRYFAPDRGT